jgi:hypothetical protein
VPPHRTLHSLYLYRLILQTLEGETR